MVLPLNADRSISGGSPAGTLAGHAIELRCVHGESPLPRGASNAHGWVAVSRWDRPASSYPCPAFRTASAMTAASIYATPAGRASGGLCPSARGRGGEGGARLRGVLRLLGPDMDPRPRSEALCAGTGRGTSIGRAEERGRAACRTVPARIPICPNDHPAAAPPLASPKRHRGCPVGPGTSGEASGTAPEHPARDSYRSSGSLAASPRRPQGPA